MRFGLFAARALTAADGSSIPQDGLIETASVDADGTACFTADLPLGSYFLKELAVDAHYILSVEKYPLDFAYAGQDTAVVDLKANEGSAIENRLIRGRVEGRKVDETGAGQQGVLFGLFAADATEFTAEKAIRTAASDAGGRFTFDDLPYGEYLVRELQGLDGYTLDTVAHHVQVTADGQAIPLTVTDHATRIEVLKTNITGEQALPGAILELRDAAGKVLDRWTGTEQAHAIDKLTVGAVYTLHEVTPPAGYASTQDMPFTVQNTGAVQTLKLYDDSTHFEFHKTDAATGAELPGAHLTVTDSTGKVIDDWISADTPHSIQGLTVGQSYTLTEISAPSGYDTAERISFTVSDTAAVQKIEMRDSRTPGTPAVPQTGDASHPLLWSVVLAAGAVSIAVLACFLRRHHVKKQQ